MNNIIWYLSLIYFSSVTQSCPTLYDPMNHSTPGLPVHHQLPESTQTCVHESVMPSNHLILCHPLLQSSLLQSFPASESFQMSQLFASGGQSIEAWASHQSLQWTFRTDFLRDGLIGSPCCLRDSQESSPTPQFKSINYSVLSFLYSPTLTSIHDYWNNHSRD